MAISFSCTNCLRPYKVADSLAGKKAKCKDCGTVMQIPSGSPEPALASAESEPNDLYGFNDRSSATAAAAEDDASYASAPESPLPRSGKKKKKKKNQAGSGEKDERYKSLWSSIACVIFGFIAHEMPLHGLVLSKRGMQMDPMAQYYLGAIAVLLGAVLVIGWTAWAGVNYLRDSELPDMNPGQNLGWAGGVLASLVLGAVVFQRMMLGLGAAPGNPDVAAKQPPGPRLADVATARPLARNSQPNPDPTPIPNPTPNPIPPSETASAASPSSPTSSQLMTRFTAFRLNPQGPGADPNSQTYTLDMDYRVLLGNPGNRTFDWVLIHPDRSETVLAQVSLQHQGTLSTSVTLPNEQAPRMYQVKLRAPNDSGKPTDVSLVFPIFSHRTSPRGITPPPNIHRGPSFPTHRPPNFRNRPHFRNRPRGFPGSQP